MKKIILILLFSFLILTVIAGNSALTLSAAVAGNENHPEKTEDHKHNEDALHKEDHEQGENHEDQQEKTEDNKHDEDTVNSGEHEEGEDHDEHNHKEGNTCGVGQYHDRFILDTVLEQPWRHPEKLSKDMWLLRIAPLSFLFLLSIALRPAVNKFMKKVGK